MKHGKKYTESAKQYDRAKQYDAAEAIDLVINNAKAKFDETIELHVRLGVDPKQADQQVRGVIVLPTERVKPSEYSSLQKAKRQTRLRQRARITSARKNSLRRFRKTTGSNSIPLLPLPT